MNKVFVKLYRIAVILIVFLAAINLFSCSGLLLNNSASGSVSFEIDSSILNASRNGDIIGNHERSYRVEVTLEDNKANKVQQIINVSSTDFNECLETDRKMVAEFEKIPVGRTCFAEIKIFPEIKVEESSDSEDFEQEPAIVGKSKKFKVKAGKNDISVNAYYYRYAFPFSITISFEDLNQGELETIKNNLIIDALTTDSENAARLAQAGNDKYKIYETCSQSLYGDGQLSIYSDDTTFKINDDNKSLTVTGKMYLPISELDYATQGKDIVLVAVMYAYDTNSGTLKTKLFGKSDTITPLKGQTNAVSFTAKKLNILDTPVVTYSTIELRPEGKTYHYTIDDNDYVSAKSDSFCFDQDGYFYTLNYNSSNNVTGYTVRTTNPLIEEDLSIGNSMYKLTLVCDIKTNVMYSYYCHEGEIVVYEYPKLISEGTAENPTNNSKTISSFIYIEGDNTYSLWPSMCVINNGIVYVLAFETSGNISDYFLFTASLQDDSLSDGKRIDLSKGDLKDMIYLDDSIYFVLRNVSYDFKGPDAIYSLGELVQYNLNTEQTKRLGYSSDTITSLNANVDPYAWDNNDSQYCQLFYGENNKPSYITINTSDGSTPLYEYLSIIHTPSPFAETLSNDAFYGPQKIIGIKPKKTCYSR